ncbi:mediator of RNA polymerase II transcription subunit 30 [Coccinella septempunctata]|uniref:mediator of RNA polymerase II transcription subunit 30 n=1 Tax=Coccinella septempunctata TaxID=41139 RepID=UPI001D0992D5|nr:mediator of RNA polymerase II transcription subunit 30 [Coccinella septempunctata]
MAGPPHHYMTNMNNPQTNQLRNPFVQSPMQNQLGSNMPMQMANSIGAQMSQGMMSPMSSSLGNQMSAGIGSGNQMLTQMNQQYNMNAGNQMTQPPNNLQIGNGGMEFSNMHTVQQPQQTAMQPNPGVVATPPVQVQQQQQSKEFNTASLCRIGQETVQDIVSRTQEVFQTLKAMQPPNGTSASTNTSNEKKVKVQEQLRTIRVLFKRLRLIFERCNENCQIQGMEYTHIESLIPFKDEMDPKHDEKKNTEAYRLACLESKEVMEQVVLKNKQLKEVIDQLRRIIWEINTMLTMRRS